MSSFAVLVCVVATAALVWAEWRGSQLGKWLAKPLAASAFVWAAIEWGALASPYGQRLTVGLILCWLGDVLLIPKGQTVFFRAGIAAFLLGHLAYAWAFSEIPGGALAGSVAAGVLIVVAWRVLRWLSPHVPGDLVWPVRAYVGVISTMLVFSAAAVAAGGPVLIGLGAVGFAASDLSVARDRFMSPGFANSAWGLPLYFAAQLALASTVQQIGSQGP